MNICLDFVLDQYNQEIARGFDHGSNILNLNWKIF